jgi:asparagine synthase (glutamine-hydrolysing)
MGRRCLPDHLLEHKKRGFVLPMRQWIRDWFGAHGGPAEYFSARPILRLDPEALIALTITGPREEGERLFFTLILFAEWWHTFRRQTQSIALRS